MVNMNDDTYVFGHDGAPEWLLRFLRAIPGVDLESTNQVLEVSVAGGQPTRFRVERRSRVGPKAARMFEQLELPGAAVRVLLATRRVSPTARQHLRKAGISWVERDTGFCRLVGPGLLIERTLDQWTDREKSARGHGPDKRARRLLGLSGVVAETLLVHYRNRPIKVSGVAEEAAVSIGLVSRIVHRLEEEGILTAEGKGRAKRRFLQDPAALLDLWADEEKTAADEMVKAYVWVPAAADLYRELAVLDDAGIAWALAGVAAANLYAPTLTTTPTPEIWIAADRAPVEAVQALNGEVVDEAENLVLRLSSGDPALRHAQTAMDLPGPTSQDAQGLRLVSAPRAYVEARSGAKRAHEVAENLREKLGY